VTAPDHSDPSAPAAVPETRDGAPDHDDAPVRRVYRLRAPDVEHTTSAVSVRVTDGEDLYLAVGRGSRRMYLTPAEAWALWRCLSEAVSSTGTPPDWIRVPINPTTR
jgi:hypothetical protein